MKRFIWIGVFILLLAGGYLGGRQARRSLAAANRVTAAGQAAAAGPPRQWIEPNARARGPATAPVTVILFGDFQCPSCGEMFRNLEEIRRSHAEDVRLFYFNYPSRKRQSARQLALAALAAEEQGKFWEYYDHQFLGKHGSEVLEPPRIAAALGLDSERFAKDLTSGILASRLDAERQVGDRLEIVGTPTIFVNGRRQLGATPKEPLTKLITREIALAKEEMAKGVAGDQVYRTLTSGAAAQVR